MRQYILYSFVAMLLGGLILFSHINPLNIKVGTRYSEDILSPETLELVSIITKNGDWNIYNDTVKGVYFRYPSHWSVADGPSVVNKSSPISIKVKSPNQDRISDLGAFYVPVYYSIRVSEVSKDSALYDWYSSVVRQPSRTTQKETVKLDESSAVLLFGSASDVGFDECIISIKNRLFIVQIGNEYRNQETIDDAVAFLGVCLSFRLY